MVNGGSSPKNRTIETIADDGDAIWRRGYDIEQLGTMMKDAATTLEQIKASSLEGAEMVGKAVEALKECIGDSYKTLREAGDLYEPVGPPIQVYGSTLMAIKRGMNTSAEECEEKWCAYQSAPGGTEFPAGLGPEPGTPEAADNALEAERKQDLYDAWHAEAVNFDSYYDTWESAYEDAVAGVTDGVADGIKDGFWEVLDDIIKVLEIVALVVLVAALVLTGPFAAIAFAISAAILVARTIQYCAGECSLAELGLAALDVVPFGKFGKMADAVNALGDASKFAKFSAGLKVASGADDIAFRGFKSFPDIMTGLHSGLSMDDFARLSTYTKPLAAGGEIQGAMLKYGGTIFGNTNTIIGLTEGSLVDAFS